MSVKQNFCSRFKWHRCFGSNTICSIFLLFVVYLYVNSTDVVPWFLFVLVYHNSISYLWAGRITMCIDVVIIADSGLSLYGVASMFIYTFLLMASLRNNDSFHWPSKPRFNDFSYISDNTLCLHLIKSSSWLKSAYIIDDALSAFDILCVGILIVLLLLRPTIPHALVLMRSGEKSKADDDGAFPAMTMAMKVAVKRLFILDVDDSCIICSKWRQRKLFAINIW